MKEIKRTRTIEETVGYEAEDGKVFKTKEECEKYEQTAEAVINNTFKRLMVGGRFFEETQIWENFGYGSEEFDLAIIEVKDEDDLRVANMYGELHKKGTPLGKEIIGKRVLVELGNPYDRDCGWRPRTEDELIEQFKADIKKFFHPEKDVNESKD